MLRIISHNLISSMFISISTINAFDTFQLSGMIHDTAIYYILALIKITVLQYHILYYYNYQSMKSFSNFSAHYLAWILYEWESILKVVSIGNSLGGAEENTQQSGGRRLFETKKQPLSAGEIPSSLTPMTNTKLITRLLTFPSRRLNGAPTTWKLREIYRGRTGKSWKSLITVHFYVGPSIVYRYC